MAKKNTKKNTKKIIDNLLALLEDVYTYGGEIGYGKFLTYVVRRINEEKDNFAKMIKEKKVALEETPLTRKQFDEEIAKVNAIPNPFNANEFDTKSESFHLQALEYFVRHRVTDEAKAEAIISLIWEKLDFYSLFSYFRNHEYNYNGEHFYEYDEEGDNLPVSSYHIYSDVSFNMFIYQGNLVDKIIEAMS